MKAIVPGQSNIAIDAADFSAAALAFGSDWNLQAALEIERAIGDSGQVVKRAVIKRAKRHRKSGRLEKKIWFKQFGAGWDTIAKVHSGGPVAHLIAGGVGRHRIPMHSVVRPSMPLYEGGRIQGYARGANHPGFRKDPYFHVGAMNSRLAINAILKASAKRLATNLAEVIKLKGTGH